MPELAMPSRELARRLTAKLGYEGKVLGTEMGPMSGCCDVFLFSLGEVADFLEADPRSITEMTGFIRFIEPEFLRAWVGGALGDSELAQAIGGIIATYETCPDSVQRYLKQVAAIRPIKELLLARLRQCQAVLGEESTVKEEIHG